MTGSYGLILPLMIANMTAYGLAKHFRPVPIYEALLEQDGVHLPHHTKGVAHALEQIKVAESMQTEVITINADSTIAQAVELTQKYEFTTFPVVDEGFHCVGAVTEMRLRRNLAQKGGANKVREIADKCHTLYPDHLLSRAVVSMNQAGVRQLSVIERGAKRKLLGILTMSDIVRAQAEVIGAPETQTEISVVPPFAESKD
jgi:CIC family chloride channel protein